MPPPPLETDGQQNNANSLLNNFSLMLHHTRILRDINLDARLISIRVHFLLEVRTEAFLPSTADGHILQSIRQTPTLTPPKFVASFMRDKVKSEFSTFSTLGMDMIVALILSQEVDQTFSLAASSLIPSLSVKSEVLLLPTTAAGDLIVFSSLT